MKKNYLFYILLFITFCNTEVKAQETTENTLDLMIRIAERWSSVVKKAETSSSIEMYKELKSVLDTLDENNIVGTMPAVTLSEMISNTKARKDTATALTQLLDLRNRAYRKLQSDISNSFNYGLGELEPTSNQWIGESALAMTIFRFKALELLNWSPNEATTQFAYEALMHTKGMRLMADNNFKFMAIESGNNDILNLYSRLLNAQKRYTELFTKYSSNMMAYQDEFDPQIADFPKLRDLRAAVAEIKDSIYTVANTNPSYINKFFTSWIKIRDKLSDKEACIEFAEVANNSGGSNIIALLIDNSCSYPRYFDLCDKEDIKTIDATREDGLAKIYEKIWKPMTEALKKKEKIYFSPDGILYSLPIEYCLQDKTLCRITSSKELIRTDVFPKRLDIVAYGGLDYDLGETLSDDTQSKTRGTSTSDITRGIKEALPGSFVEVGEIEKMAKRQSNTSVIVYKGKEGTEESFYKLENSKFNILHISTHGFYYTPEEVKDRECDKTKYSFMDFDNKSLDADMTHTGLLFSGANKALRGENIPKGCEDGILTAKEIADTNLSSCDMVVLAACRSGLGAATPEGIYGLQRGFKKAGIRTILMTLWDVDDKATQLFSVEFYKQLMSGASPQNALKVAQQHIRQQGEDYGLPYYWAGFILLDALY